MISLELDHTGVAVRDLDIGQAAYRKLGFNLTPRSFHSGSRTAGGPVEKWGSGNHCAMFENGYLEIIGITDPNLYSSTQAYLERYAHPGLVVGDRKDPDSQVSKSMNDPRAYRVLEELNTDPSVIYLKKVETDAG